MTTATKRIQLNTPRIHHHIVSQLHSLGSRIYRNQKGKRSHNDPKRRGKGKKDFLWDVEGEVMRVRSGKKRRKGWGLYQRENGKRTCIIWHFGNSEPSISRADNTFSTPRTCDQQRRESWLFVTSSHSQTLIWISLLNRLRLNILTKTYTVERKTVCTIGNRCFQRRYIVNGELFVGLFTEFNVYTYV